MHCLGDTLSRGCMLVLGYPRELQEEAQQSVDDP